MYGLSAFRRLAIHKESTMKPSDRSRPSDRQPLSVPGAILSDALYRLDEAAARLGWGGHALLAFITGGSDAERN